MMEVHTADDALLQSLTPFHPDIRRIWHQNEWHYAVIDIIAFLIQSKDPGGYWRNTKKRLLDVPPEENN